MLLHLKWRHNDFAISVIIMAIDVILPKFAMFGFLSDKNAIMPYTFVTIQLNSYENSKCLF